MAKQSDSSKYSGKMNPEQLSQGIKCCIENAENLLVAAANLIELQLYAPASSLCFTALEEIGKVHIFQRIAQYPRKYQKHWKPCWNEFRNHRWKYTCGIMDSYGDEYRSNLFDILHVADRELRISGFAERMRQFGLYVDFNKSDETWYQPSMCNKKYALSVYNDVSRSYERIRAIFDIGLCDADMLSRLCDIYGELMVRKDQIEDNPSELAKIEQELKNAHRDYFKLAVKLGKLTGDEEIPLFDGDTWFA
jgi:AbiV family abortive infection protein